MSGRDAGAQSKRGGRVTDRDHFACLQEERLKMLVEIQQRMLRPIIWDEETEGILGTLGTAIGADATVLWRRKIAAPGMLFVRQGVWGEHAIPEKLDLAGDPLEERVAAGEEIWIDGAAPFGSDGKGRALLMPLVSRDQLYGLVVVEVAGPEDLAEGGGLEFLRVVAVSMAMALERSHYHRALKESQARLLQSQKLEAVGQFAGGIAHDFNNLLTVIRGYTTLLRDQLPEDSVSARMNEEVAKAAERAVGLTKQLLTFARRRKLELKVIDLNEVVREIEPMLARLLGATIRLQVSFGADSVRAKADANLIEQAIVNLAVNARDAMPEGGTLVIQTSIRRFVQGQAGLPKGIPAQAYCCIEFSDTGEGIAQSVREHIFEPFFTTKPVGKGTGLGLATVYAILQQHQGWVEIESEPGDGAQVRMFLPFLGEGKVEATCPVPETLLSVERAGERKTILLVEDDDAVLRLAQMVLEHSGYEVICARSGPEAVATWERVRSRVDLLMTDIVMPEKMSGIELVERLTAEKPDLRVILVSGYSPGLDRIDTRDGRTVFLQKPYDTSQLRSALRDLLEEDGAAKDG